MSLKDKYAALIEAAQSQSVRNLQVREQDGVLYIDGEVDNGQAKDQLWNTYNQIDPDFRAADVIMNVNVVLDAQAKKYQVTTEHSNLNIRKGPGTDQPILGKAAHHSIVTLLSKYNSEWSLIRNDQDIEGYCSAKYLTEQA